MLQRQEHVKYTYRQLSDALLRLKNDFLEGAKHEYFFHYPKELAAISDSLIIATFEGYSVSAKWAPIVAAFPSSEREIQAGIDCYAFGDPAGCVFHMMRIAELGLRTIARERGVTSLSGKRGQLKPIEWGTWQEVFDAIDGRLGEVRRANPGPGRDSALSFYETAVRRCTSVRGTTKGKRRVRSSGFIV
jgi:hypothetical protein